jgi:hypothetical protein
MSRKILVGALFISMCFNLVAATRLAHQPRATVAACASDDGTSRDGYPCVWNARTQGNGLGSSFVSFGPDGPFIQL